MLDFTFKNEMIQNYFNGDDSYAPSSELIYLHEHPLIAKSFLVEMEILINKTAEHLIKHNVIGTIVNRFTEATIRLGAELPSISQQNAPKILKELREIYTLCKALLD